MITVPLASARYIVLEDDESLDKEHPDFNWAEYRRTGESKYIPVKEGGMLTRFQIEPLSVRAYERVMNLREQSTSMAWEAVALGLLGSENYKVDGIEAQWKRHTVSGLKRLTEECFAKNFKPAIYYEISGRIMEISSLDPTPG